MKNLALLISLTLLLSTCQPKPIEPTRPNILFIMSDDHAYQAISAYNDALLPTPNIDRLAREGMLFWNASVTNSICAPSRATILTGKHTHIHGKKDNISPFDTSQVTFPQLLRKHGYQTALFGKLHFGNNPKGFDDFAILPGQGDYYNPDFITSTEGRIHTTGYATEIITDMSIDWLDQHKDQDEPFMMMYFHKSPHRPWWPTAEKMAEFRKKTFPKPATLHDDFATRGEAARTAEMGILEHMLLSYDCKVLPAAVEQLDAAVDDRDTRFFEAHYNKANDQQKARLQPILDSIAAEFLEQWPDMDEREKRSWKYQRYMQDYLACVSIMDDNIGRVLDYLEENGLAENTIVVYTSDQGFYLGEHGWFDKRFIYQESFKTPLLIRWPQRIEAGAQSNAMVQNLDFAPTLLEAAGVPVPDDMQGQSFMPVLTSEGDWERAFAYYHYYEYPGEHAVKRHYGIVSTDHKLVHFYHDIDEWELYDLTKDKYEVNNVYGDPAYRDIQDRMHRELERIRKEYQVPEDGPVRE